MKKNIKLVLALVLAMMIVVSMIPAMAAAKPYTITVNNSNSKVTINGKTFSAYKLFDLSYVDEGNQNTVYGIDETPHSYYLSTNSAFYTGAAYTEGTGYTATANSPAAVLLKYFTFTKLAGDDTKVLVKPIVNASNQSTFTAQKAYEMTQELVDNGVMDNLTADGTSEAATGETAVIELDNPGYYLVTGSGLATSDNKTVVTAAVALTSTDPAANIIAKLDAPDVDKKIDGDNDKEWDDSDPKFSQARPNDNVPFVVKGNVPNMTGFEDNYYYIVTDTLSKGLTFKNDTAIKIKSAGDEGADLTVPRKDAADSSVTTLYYVVEYKYDSDSAFKPLAASATLPTKPEGEETTFRVLFYNFLSLKGELIEADDVDPDDATIGTYTNPYAGNDIIITYSADINGEAVIGVEGNPNKVKLTYSTNPNDEGEGEGKPNEDELDVVGDGPDHFTNTYVTGLKLFKYEGAAKNPLAGATFELTGANVLDIKETTKDVFVPASDGEYFLLADGNFTKTAPVASSYNETTNTYTHGTKGKYKTVAADSTQANAVAVTGINGVKFLKYKKTTVTDWTKTPVAGSSTKYTVKTGADGVITFTGLKEGNYTLTETVAPTGYNVLEKPIYIKITCTTPSNPAVAGTGDCTWHAYLCDSTFTALTKGGEGADKDDPIELSLTEANLFLEEVENKAGVELPSTGGIGTTIFYVAGSILVLAAAILLITKRRMSTND